MGKVLVWVVIALVAWAAWRLFVVSQRRTQRARDAAASGTPGTPGTPGAAGGGDADPEARGARRPGAPELMMQCAVCGVHLPGSEARFAGGRVYCSDAHRDQATAGSAPERAPHERR
jgi:uncharacterized protein